MKTKRWMSMLAALALPWAAQAETTTLQENVAIVLPTLAPVPSVTVVAQENEYAIDLEAYYAGDYASSVYSYQMPALTPEEQERAQTAQARYDAGERPAHHILHPIENVSIGVYELPPEQYQGETVFVLLPCRELTDEELLQLVDAYAKLGQRFDPAGLSWRNCSRGGSIECTRAFAGDERERYASLMDLYRRSLLQPSSPMSALPCDDGFGLIRLNAEEFSGMTEFRFFPARRLTDEELLQYAEQNIGDERGEAEEYSAWETQLRLQMYNLMGTPLSAERIYESLRNETQGMVYGADRQIYNAQFTLIGEQEWGSNHDGCLATADGTLASATIYAKEQSYSDLHCDPFDAKWSEIAAAWVKANRKDGVQIARVESYGEEWLQWGGYGARIVVAMEDGGAYVIAVNFATELPCWIEYSDAVLTENQNDYFIHSLEKTSRD